MIELQQVEKRFGSTIALQAIDLQIPQAESTVLIGQSGCGKSTLLRLINGLIEPDRGTILVGGEALTSENARSHRHRMGYVIQEGGLFPHLTAAENVTLLGNHLGRPATWLTERTRELADLVHLPGDMIDRYPQQLSGGQRQRVSLMRALLLDPDVLLLDEPLGALDPIIRSDLQQELREIFRDLGKSVVMVTHDLAEAAFFGDHIVLLRDGRIVQRGSIHDLLHEPSEPFVSDFVNAQRALTDITEETP